MAGMIFWYVVFPIDWYLHNKLVRQRVTGLKFLHKAKASATIEAKRRVYIFV